jgi:hypothetical protein
MNERAKRENEESRLTELLCYGRFPHDDAALLRHQVLMGDVHILPEDVGRINTELQWGESLASLRSKGLLGT